MNKTWIINELKKAIDGCLPLTLEHCVELFKLIESQESALEAQQKIINDLGSEEKVSAAYKLGVSDAAFDYKNSMILSIAEMFKYGEIGEEQRDLLYHHNYQVYRQYVDAEESDNERIST